MPVEVGLQEAKLWSDAVIACAAASSRATVRRRHERHSRIAAAFGAVTQRVSEIKSRLSADVPDLPEIARLRTELVALVGPQAASTLLERTR